MKDGLILFTALSLFSLGAACSKKQVEPNPQAGQGAGSTSKGGTATDSAAGGSPTAPTALSEAQAMSVTDLKSPKLIETTLRRAKTLDEWLKSNAGHKEHGSAQVLGAQLRIQAVAAAVGLGTGPSLKALGPKTADSKHLGDAVAWLEAAAKAGVSESKEWLLAAKAMIGSDPNTKEVAFDRKAALEMAQGGSPAGQALRAFWLNRLGRALQALHSEDLSKRFGRFAALAGRLLCPACADARHATPDVVTSSLLMDKNKGGFICDLAFIPETGVLGPSTQIAAISRCGAGLMIGPVAEPVMYWGSNLLAAGLMVMAKDLSVPQIEDGALSSAIKKRTGVVKELLERAVVLPTPRITGRLPEAAPDAPRSRAAAIEGLGFGGQTSTRPSIPVFEVGPKDVTAFLRPIVKIVEGAVQSVSLQADTPAAPVPLETLRNAEIDAETGAVAAIKAAAERKRDAIKGIKAHPVTADKESIDLLVDALAPAWAVERTVDSLRATGYAHFRFLRTAVHGQSLPLVVRDAEPELVQRLNVGYERPLLAHVTAKHVDVWWPKKKTAATLKKDTRARQPKAATAGYRGKRVVRLRINIPGGMGYGIDNRTLAKIGEVLEYARASTGAGPLLHVVAGADALAADVLRVSRIFQEGKGDVLAGDAAIWPGTKCAKSNVANRGAAQCPTGVAVAFSKNAVPSSKGVTSVAADAPKKEVKIEEKPKTGFCDKRAIGSKMRRRKAAFRFCYEKALRMQKDLAGRVKLRFTIGASGSVLGTPAVVSASLKNAAVHKCLVKNVKRVKFDPPEGGTCTVSWPFKFKVN